MALHPLPSHFASFFSNLNPGSSFETTASSQYNTIKALIEDRRGPAAGIEPSCFLQGSYRQQTSIHSINDVDIVALCKLWYPGSGVGRSFSRDDIFNIIAAPLLADGRYSSKVRFGPTSMCIKVDLGIKVEILPVVFTAGNTNPQGEPFKLYRPTSRTWENGFARNHQAYLTAKNKPQTTANNFIPAIKILKHLRTINRLQAVSFHIECLLYSLPDLTFTGSPTDFIPAMLGTIASVDAATWYGKNIYTPCRDRDIFTENEWGAESWFAFHAEVKRWSQLATLARNAQSKTDAIRLWRTLLGVGYFPETTL